MSASISIPVSAATAKTGSSVKTRLGYIDQIRVILIVLVVMVHAGVTYGSIGGWFYVESGSDSLTSALLSLFVTLCQSFFMGLFFFISAYFTPGSYDRKGAGGFWKDRLLRLGLPFAFFSVILAKYPMYIYYTRNAGYSGSLLDFTREYFGKFDAGPTWFLFALLVLGAGYSLWRLLRGAKSPGGLAVAAPKSAGLLLFALLMAALMLLFAQFSPIGDFKPLFGFIYLQPAFFPQYVLMYIGGLLAARNRWLDSLDGSLLRSWKWVAAGCLAALPVLFVAGGAAEGKFAAFISGFTWQCMALNLWVGLTCVSFSLVLILGLRARQTQPGNVQKEIRASAFAAFLIHPVVLVAITSSLSPLGVPALLKFGLASVLAVSASFGLGWLLRKIPGIQAIL